jgi:hypothetical protein
LEFLKNLEGYSNRIPPPPGSDPLVDNWKDIVTETFDVPATLAGDIRKKRGMTFPVLEALHNEIKGLESDGITTASGNETPSLGDRPT